MNEKVELDPNKPNDALAILVAFAAQAELNMQMGNTRLIAIETLKKLIGDETPRPEVPLEEVTVEVGEEVTTS